MKRDVLIRAIDSAIDCELDEEKWLAGKVVLRLLNIRGLALGVPWGADDVFKDWQSRRSDAWTVDDVARELRAFVGDVRARQPPVHEDGETPSRGTTDEPTTPAELIFTQLVAAAFDGSDRPSDSLTRTLLAVSSQLARLWCVVQWRTGEKKGDLEQVMQYLRLSEQRFAEARDTLRDHQHRQEKTS